MTSEAPGAASGFGRFLVIVLLLAAIGGFGCATLCGGIFTVASFGDARGMGDIWMIALPSLLIGGWLCWLCTRTLLRTLRRPRAAPPPAPPAE